MNKLYITVYASYATGNINASPPNGLCELFNVTLKVMLRKNATEDPKKYYKYDVRTGTGKPQGIPEETGLS